MNAKIIKPIIKWVGGKTQIIDTLLTEFPTEIHNYYEPFVGGGSVLFGLLSYKKLGLISVSGSIYVYDINEPLIYMYKNIQKTPDLLYIELKKLINEFTSCDEGDVNRKPKTLEEAMSSKENYYYWVREKYNKLSSEEKTSCLGSAMFIFLNKTSFRGIFRLGPNGYNVPYGHYKNPEIVNQKHLQEIHTLIQGVIFECLDFTKSLAQVRHDNDFIYLDPPYVPETSKSFVGYTENGFDNDKHKTLFSILNSFTSLIKFILSNSDVELVRESFKTYCIIPILCKRSINSKNPNSKAKEVIIKNY